MVCSETPAAPPATPAQTGPAVRESAIGGAKRPVVMVHGSLTAGAMWKRMIACLDDRYAIVAPDLTGYGGTPAWHGRRPFRLTDDLACIDVAMAGMDAPFDLVGHSYGGLVALRYAWANPHRVRSLLVFEPTVFRVLRDADAGTPEAFAEIDRVSRVVRAGLRAGVPATAMRHFVDYWNGRGAWKMLPEERRELFSAQAGTVADNFAAGWTDDMPVAGLRGLDVPTFVVAGAATTAASLTTARTLAALLPDAESMTVGGAGHMLPLTHPEEAVRIVSGWLADPYVDARGQARAGTPTSSAGAARAA